MVTQKWKQTHVIECQPGGFFYVMLHDGAFYTQGIYEEKGEPEWICDENGNPRYVAGGWNPHNGLVDIELIEIPNRPCFSHTKEDYSDEILCVLRKIARNCRNAFESIRSEQLLCEGNLRFFPSNCCDRVSRLLILYLHEHTTFGSFRVIYGDYYTESHAWVEQDGVIIDVTADQFEEGLPRVLVTRNSIWHESWTRRDESYTGSYEEYQKRIKESDGSLYAWLVKQMKQAI